MTILQHDRTMRSQGVQKRHKSSIRGRANDPKHRYGEDMPCTLTGESSDRFAYSTFCATIQFRQMLNLLSWVCDPQNVARAFHSIPKLNIRGRTFNAKGGVQCSSSSGELVMAKRSVHHGINLECVHHAINLECVHHAINLECAHHAINLECLFLGKMILAVDFVTTISVIKKAPLPPLPLQRFDQPMMR